MQKRSRTSLQFQLSLLFGIAQAQAIIDGRPYNAPEDIMKIRGTKEGSFNKIKKFITVR